MANNNDEGDQVCPQQKEEKRTPETVKSVSKEKIKVKIPKIFSSLEKPVQSTQWDKLLFTIVDAEHSNQSSSLQTNSEIFNDEDCKWLLKLLERLPPHCFCTTCARDHLRELAYEWAEELKICPKSWKKEKRATEEWLSNFEKEIKDIFELFPFSDCLSNSSNSQLAKQSQFLSFVTKDVIDENNSLQTSSKIFNDKDCKWLLKLLTRFPPQCFCTICARNRLREMAYEWAEKEYVCPKSWKKEKRATEKWLHTFEKEIINISKIFPLFKCVSDLSTSQTSQSQSLLPAKNVIQLQQSTADIKSKESNEYELKTVLSNITNITSRKRTWEETVDFNEIPLSKVKENFPKSVKFIKSPESSNSSKSFDNSKSSIDSVPQSSQNMKAKQK